MPLTRKPRIAIMGEFSSGKSTLCNVLMGAKPLLEKVTATQLPPVWLSYGPDDAYTMGLDGHAYDLDLAELEQVSLETTEHIRIFMKSDILRYCDLIDMPGISDPSMSSEVWERMAHLADARAVVHPCDAGLAAVGIGGLVDLPEGNAAQQPAS